MVAQAAFPFVDPTHFAAACEQLEDLFRRHGHEQDDWYAVVRSISSNLQPWLRITRRLPTPSSRLVQPQADYSFAHEESDEQEALSPLPTEPMPPLIEYNILLSPIYCVPVLYIAPWTTSVGVTGPGSVLPRLITPELLRPQVESVGTSGAISMKNHPMTDAPAFFVHPCNTAAALSEAASSQEMTPLEYLQLWLGVVGGCVGLQLPIVLASRKAGGTQ